MPFFWCFGIFNDFDFEVLERREGFLNDFNMFGNVLVKRRVGLERIGQSISFRVEAIKLFVCAMNPFDHEAHLK